MRSKEKNIVELRKEVEDKIIEFEKIKKWNPKWHPMVGNMICCLQNILSLINKLEKEETRGEG